MKKVFLILLVLALMAPMASAATTTGTKMQNSVVLDAPELVQMTRHTYLGLEAGKKMGDNLIIFDNKAWEEDDYGYFANIKITYTGTLFSFAK